MSATIIPIGDRSLRFGARVTVRALTQPWIGHNNASVPRYYAGHKPKSLIELTASALSADDGRPETWPGSPVTGSDSPWPGQHETHLRWRRFSLDPAPLRGVLLRAVSRGEGTFAFGKLRAVQRVQLAEVVIDTSPPRRILTDPADLIPGWSATA